MRLVPGSPVALWEEAAAVLGVPFVDTCIKIKGPQGRKWFLVWHALPGGGPPLVLVYITGLEVFLSLRELHDLAGSASSASRVPFARAFEAPAHAGPPIRLLNCDILTEARRGHRSRPEWSGPPAMGRDLRELD